MLLKNCFDISKITDNDFFIYCNFRIWWFAALALSFGLCCTSIINIWIGNNCNFIEMFYYHMKYVLSKPHKILIDWNENPVTVSDSGKSFQIDNVPNPTITICPGFKILKNKFDLPATLKNLSSLTDAE